ncbi:MAG: formylglycine-generating enzyme family protein [Planctomycetales bacterium]|nr:formylglycine-generating enzyme family protein [Planctomycetales bacterium]
MPLALGILEPSEGAAVGGALLVVLGSVSDPTASVTVNGVAASKTGTQFTARLPQVPEGAAEVVAVATLGEAKVTAKRSVRVDRSPPRIRLASPAPDLETRETTLAVSGEVEEDGPFTLVVNDALVAAKGRAFSTEVNLGKEAATTITVTARDAAGNLDRVVRSVRSDSTAPKVAIMQPEEGALTNLAVLDVRLECDDPSARIAVNGSKATALDQRGRFRARVPVPEGEVTLAVEARDGAGNSGSASRKIRADRTPPRLGLSEPREGLVTRSAEVPVRGTVDDGSVKEVRVGARKVPVVEGAFDGAVALEEGAQELRIEARDLANNVASLRVNVTRDSREPRIQVQRPLDGTVVLQLTAEVAGRVSEPVTRLSVNGQPVEVAPDRTFRTVVPLEEGRNAIEIASEDAAGNSARVKLVVVRRRADELRVEGMVLVRDGPFVRGNFSGTRDEQPEHEVFLAAYQLDEREVSNAQYSRFIAWVHAEQAEGRNPHARCHPDEPPGKEHTPQYWEDPARNAPNLPVTGVDWFDAYAYARWAGRRLPTESEWERAAGWVEDTHSRRLYPWGEAFDLASGSFDLRSGARPCGTSESDKSPAGALDMGGNVQEWCADWFRGSYDREGATVSARGSEPYRPRFRVVRGASFALGHAHYARTTYRMPEDPLARRPDLGFRTCRTP